MDRNTSSTSKGHGVIIGTRRCLYRFRVNDICDWLNLPYSKVGSEALKEIVDYLANHLKNLDQLPEASHSQECIDVAEEYFSVPMIQLRNYAIHIVEAHQRRKHAPMEYRQSKPYQTGLMYQEYANLLMDPGTTVEDLAAFAKRYEMDFDIVYSPMNTDDEQLLQQPKQEDKSNVSS